jgi:hypothetical protein
MKHECLNWDYLLIGPADPEMSGCTCKPIDPLDFWAGVLARSIAC